MDETLANTAAGPAAQLPPARPVVDASPDLVARLRRLLAVAGVVVGAATVAEIGIALVIWLTSSDRPPAAPAISPLRWTGVILVVLSGLLLAAGAIGHWAGHRRARPALLAYLAAWLTGAAVLFAAQTVDVWRWPDPLSAWGRVVIVAGQLQYWLTTSSYALILLFFLRWPGVVGVPSGGGGDDDATPRPARERLVRALAWVALYVGGVALAGLAARMSQYGRWELPLGRPSDVEEALRTGQSFLKLGGACLALVGGAAVLARRGWGRLLLVLYASFWIAGAAAEVAWQAAMVVSRRWGSPSTPVERWMTVAIDVFVQAPYCAHAAFVLVCLRWPAVRERLAGGAGGFEPILLRRNG